MATTQAGQRIAKGLGQGSLQETPFSATYDEANRMTGITLAGETFTLAYDANGNLVSRSGPVTGTTSYTWDARGQLVGISGPGGTASFAYDAFGRRIEKTVNGVRTGFLYDGAQAIAELKGSAVETVYHTGLAIDEVLARYAPSGNRTLLTDALMSVIAQANDDQTIGNYYAYSAYGEALALGPDEGNSLQYTGRENDGTGLYYYRARYYDPVLKRFISEDPIGLVGGLNSAAYVGGNPVSYIDPLGYMPPGYVPITPGVLPPPVQIAMATVRAGANYIATQIFGPPTSQVSAIIAAGTNAIGAASAAQAASWAAAAGGSVAMGTAIAVAASFTAGYQVGQMINNLSIGQFGCTPGQWIYYRFAD
jgi:RHS repeat-associated protein